jgi:multiple sugar transport system permease protein
MKKTHSIHSIFLYFGLAILAVIYLFPSAWVLLSSFKTQAEVFHMPPTFLPEKPTLGNYAEAMAILPKGQLPTSEIPNALINSIEISLSSTLILLIIGAMAGFAFARIIFPGRRGILFSLLSMRMLPPIVFAIPLFLLASSIHLRDSKFMLILTYVAFNTPFVVWLLSIFFQDVSRDIDDAARVDGCTLLSLLIYIYLPLSTPAIATVGVLAFLNIWNEFLLANILTSSIGSKTAPVAIASLQSAWYSRWTTMTAGAVLLTIPALLIALFAQRYVVEGLTWGAVKE